MAPPVYTVGHGTRPLTELVEVLTGAGITCLIDVRRYPGSRRNPQFARASLEQALPEQGIGYEWRGEELGGRRSGPATSRHPAWRVAGFRAYADHMDTAVFRDALRSLEACAGAGEKLAIMCSERLWWRCHRRLIADALTLRGCEVLHLIGPGQAQAHRLHENVRADDDGWPVYDAGVTGRLEV